MRHRAVAVSRAREKAHVRWHQTEDRHELVSIPAASPFPATRADRSPEVSQANLRLGHRLRADGDHVSGVMHHRSCKERRLRSTRSVRRLVSRLPVVAPRHSVPKQRPNHRRTFPRRFLDFPSATDIFTQGLWEGSMRFVGAIGSDASKRCRPRSFDLVEVRTGRRGDGHGISQVNRIVSRRGSVPFGQPPRRLFLFLFGTAPPRGPPERGL